MALHLRLLILLIQLIAELSDIVSACLLDLTDLSIGTNLAGSAVNDLMLTHQININRSTQPGPYRDLEANLLNAVKTKDEAATRELVRQAGNLRQQQDGRALVTRILWKVVIDASPPFADLVLASLSEPFDFTFVDDINGRTCLHEAAIAGELRLLDMCINRGVQPDRADVYGENHCSVCTIQ
jgi:CDK inhibitor PHO81